MEKPCKKKTVNRVSDCRVKNRMEGYNEAIDEMDTYLAQKDEEIRELVDVLEGILNDTDSGCPMCDSGVLRNKEKEHWDDCVYYIAEQALNKHKTINE